MTDISTALVSTATAPKAPCFLDGFTRAFSDCLEEEFDLLAADAVEDLGAKQQKERSGSVENRNVDDARGSGRARDGEEDTRELATVVKDPEQVSYLPSVGTTLHKTATDGGTTLHGDVDDEKSDFLSEKQDLFRIPSKIAFKPMKGRSFALEVRQSDLGLLREGNVSDVMKQDREQGDEAKIEEAAPPPKRETRKQRRQRRKQMKQKSKKTNANTTTTT